MGCCLATPVKPDLPPLPKNIIQLSPTTPNDTIDRVLDILTKSFTGSRTNPPEGLLAWAFDTEGNIDNDPSLPLKEEPSSQRIKCMEFVMNFTMMTCLPHGGCFALLDENNLPIAATLMIPPNKKHLHEQGACLMMAILMKHSMPSEFTSGSAAVRNDAVSKFMAKAHKESLAVIGPHWYINVMGCDPSKQGNGNGKELFKFMMGVVDHTGSPAYLETYGPKNVSFYEKNGFKEAKREEIVAKKETLTLHGGGVAMVRDPRI